MPSNALREWTTTRAADLNEIASAHVAVGGSNRGRRFATQQINRAYAVLLASHFQGYCRDLHSECVGHLLSGISQALPIVESEFLRNRKLDFGNAQPDSLGIDFKRLGLGNFWDAVIRLDPKNADRKQSLWELNLWRNAIAHQKFDPARLGGTTRLQLSKVRSWRRTCEGLAMTFDEIMRQLVLDLTLRSPW